MTKHLIIDIETLGVSKRTCPVVNVAWLYFDWNEFTQGSGYSYNLLKVRSNFAKLNIKDQTDNYGYKIEKDCLTDFWATLPKDVQEQIRPSKDDLLLSDFSKQFHEWMYNAPKVDYWWSRGNNMEPPILERIFEDTGFDEKMRKKLFYGSIRDTRTWINAKLSFNAPIDFCPVADEEAWNLAFVKHHPVDDICADVMRLQAIERGIAGLERAKIE